MRDTKNVTFKQYLQCSSDISHRHTTTTGNRQDSDLGVEGYSNFRKISFQVIFLLCSYHVIIMLFHGV